MSKIRNQVSATTGNVTGVTAGAAVSGATVFMGGTSLKVATLSALVGVTANTSGLTFTPRWQASNDASTWYTMVGANNAASVALATGASGGGNSAATVISSPPQAIEGWKYARCQLLVGVATGTTSDLYSIKYSYRQFSPGEMSK
jgi:hypothetical protein